MTDLLNSASRDNDDFLKLHELEVAWERLEEDS